MFSSNPSRALHPDVASARQLEAYRQYKGAHLAALMLFMLAWLLYGQGYRVYRDGIATTPTLDMLMIAWTAVSAFWTADRYSNFVSGLHAAPAYPSPWVVTLAMTASLVALNYLMWFAMPAAYFTAMAKWVAMSSAVMVSQLTLVAGFLMPLHRRARTEPPGPEWRLLEGQVTAVRSTERAVDLYTPDGTLTCDIAGLEERDRWVLQPGASVQVVVKQRPGREHTAIVRLLRPELSNLPWFLIP